jgi:hypothetical protein
VNTKKLAGAGAAAVGAATAVTALLLGSTTAVAAEDDSYPDYAYGVSASGLLKIDPLPYVKSEDGEPVGDRLLSIGDVLGEHEDDIALGVLTAEASAGKAETAVTELNLLNLLRADLVRTWCDDGEGGLEIVNGTILGKKIPDTSVAENKLDVSPLVSLTLNHQRRNSDDSLTVTGIELNVLPGGASNLTDTLTDEEKSALPALGALIGKPLDDTASTVGDLVDGLGVSPVSLDEPLQTITIGTANCHESGDGDGGNGNGNGDGDDNGDGDGDNGDGGGDNGDGDNGDGDSDDTSTLPAAPAPTVVEAALPVTG